MIHSVEYPSGTVLAYHKRDNGAVIVTCNDPELSLQERADRARQEVERILMMTATDYQVESVGNNVDAVV